MEANKGVISVCSTAIATNIASIGYGDYESKSAAAVGISYGSERFKFKLGRSGKATGAGGALPPDNSRRLLEEKPCIGYSRDS